MDHMRFKANLTAATYVAHGLDESAQEDFELHLMSCTECTDDVEAWRVIEKHMPREEPAVLAAAGAVSTPARLSHWRLAASLVGIGVVAAASGWYWRGFADPELERTAFFNAPPVSRGALDCTALKLGPGTERVVLRVAAVASDRNVVALNGRGEKLAASGYGARRQADGSWLLQFTAAALTHGAIRLESEGAAAGSAEPLGCVSAQLPP
jgi:hypothetical protein